MYTGEGTQNTVSGKQEEQRTSSILIEEIPERVGQILYRSLSDGLTPHGEPEHPRYRLSVKISGISDSEQAVRKDNLATRYLMTMTVKYTLYSYPENTRLLASGFSARSAYDVQRSPYATDVAEQTTKERLARIMGNDLSLRIAAFLKSYKDPRDELQKDPDVSDKQTLTAETSGDVDEDDSDDEEEDDDDDEEDDEEDDDEEEDDTPAPSVNKASAKEVHTVNGR